MAALCAMGIWGWRLSEGWQRWVLVIGIPLLWAVAWGVFAVPDDPSRSGSAPVAVPGALRLLLEVAFFSFAVWSLHQSDYSRWATVLVLLVGLHYAMCHSRVLWLLGR